MKTGKNIHDLRVKANLTQKDLGDKLNVTPQAISRWEQNLVEPSLETLKKMSQIFGVSIDQIVGSYNELEENKDTNAIVTGNVIATNEEAGDNKQKRVITYCKDCHKAIEEGEHFHTSSTGGKNSRTYEICDKCYEERQERMHAAQKIKHAKTLKSAWIRAILSGIAGVLVGVIALVIVCTIKSSATVIAVTSIFIPLLGYGAFALAFCVKMDNNFVGSLLIKISSLAFVQAPGVIFNLSLSGIISLIAIKIVLSIICTFILGFGVLIAIAICFPISMIVFPFSYKWAKTDMSRDNYFMKRL